MRILVMFCCLLTLGSCAKQKWRTSHRLDTLRANDRYVLTHVVAPGETLAQIADTYYRDSGRADWIAAENGLDPSQTPSVGSALILSFTLDEWAAAEPRYLAMEPYNRGVEALQRGEIDAADKEFREAVSLDPDFIDARYNLALVESRRGRHDAAARILEDLLDDHGREVDILFALGNARFHQTRFEDAAGLFREILALEPGHLRAAYALARTLTEDGRGIEAEAAWRAYLELDDASVWAERARMQLEKLRASIES